MHYIRFGEREIFSHKATQTLPQRIIPALYMSCFTCFFAVRLVSLKHAKAWG
jgi:hypothetical protein